MSWELIQTLADLVRINSVNPAYPHGAPEEEIQRYVLDFFQRRGIAAVEQEVLPRRANVIASLPGRNPDRRIVFEAHSDTAGIEGMTIPPFEPAVRNGRLHGRGACDTKAGLAAMMHALADLKRPGAAPPCEVWVVSAVDEEHRYRGVLKLREKLRASAAVISEPTELRMAVASKGCLRWRITVQGKAAHSSKPHLGVNAIQQMARLLVALESESERLGSVRHPLVGSPSLNVGLIEGGTQVNIVPGSCSITLDRRLIPGEDPDRVLAGYEEFLAKLQGVEPGLEVTAEPPMVQDWPLETPADSPISARASEALRGAGLDPRATGVPFGSDASKFAQAGIPAIILGPGSIDQAHAAEEYVALEQVEQAFVVYRQVMTSFE